MNTDDSISTAIAAMKRARECLNDAAEDMAKQRADLVFGVEDTAGLPALLVELVDAEEDCNEHIRSRFPEERGRTWEDQSDASHADWHRCCARRHAAQDALLRLGQAFVAARKDAA